MNADQLMSYFDRIAEAPNAVARLRRFVFELAVRGKLVEQDPRDEPASELLKRIESEKNRLVKENVIRDRDVGNSTASKQLDFQSKPGWVNTKLGTISVIQMGNSPPGSSYNTHGEGIPLINGPMEFSPGPFGKTVVNQYTTEPTSICEEGSFLICVRGSTTGRTNVAGFRACIGRGVAAIQTFFPDGFLRLLISNLRDSILAMGRGIAFPSISKKQLEELFVALPPLAEQHRIVAKVQELMALCDRLEAEKKEREARRDRLTAATFHHLNHAADESSFRPHARFALDHLEPITTRPEQIAKLRQTILNLAVRGKLVEQDEQEEPVEALLKRIEKLKHSLKKQGKLRGSTTILQATEAGSFSIPIHWCWVLFGEIMISRDGERIPISQDERQTRAKLFDYYGASGVIDKIDGYLFDKPLLLIGEDGANLINRSTPIAFIAKGKYWVNNHAHVLDGISEAFLRYIEIYINAIDLKPYVTGTAQPKMNQAKMNSIPIALPPLAEQHRIVAKVDELMALCDRLESQLTTSQTVSHRLLEAVLQKALAKP